MRCEQTAGEEAAEAQAHARDLKSENERLDAHVHDLETRKRAPLYQKKQEEELKAAVEKAAVEAEARAAEAEAARKQARVRALRLCEGGCLSLSGLGHIMEF